MTTPNYLLAVALAAARWSNHETARLLNRRATQRGYLGIAIDHTRVGRWIRRGELPRAPVPELLAELLTEHLHRPYTPRSLGIAPTRNVVVALDDHEYETLALNAAAANLPVKNYAQAVLRHALSSPFLDRRIDDLL
ncbi:MULTISPECIES: hypothetical protein [unclassified Streptomyces]|uniref:hypothetical protein n=1 Tax=unclassified Streptomyces TaxID=2593676 RepID=UPI00380235E0